MLDLLDGKVSPAARRLAAFACMAVAAPEVPAALGWVSTRVRHLAEGQDEEPASACCSPASGSAATPRRCTRTCPPPSSSRSRTTCSASPASWTRRRPCVLRSPIAIWTWRRAKGWSPNCSRAKCRRPRLALARYAVTGGRARDIVGTLDYLVELTAQARGWRIARVRAAAPIDDAQRTELTESLGTLAGAPVELQVEVDESLLERRVDPHRRPPGGRHRTGPHRRAARALRPDGWEPAGFGRSRR